MQTEDVGGDNAGDHHGDKNNDAPYRHAQAA